MAHALRILLVEDNPSLRAATRTLLRGEPAFDLVGEAADGESAVRLAGELKPDVILMDVKMPGAFDGTEATRQIVHNTRADARPPLVIGLSGSGEFQDAMRAAGAAGFMDKGSTSDLIAAIHKVVDEHALHQPRTVTP